MPAPTLALYFPLPSCVLPDDLGPELRVLLLQLGGLTAREAQLAQFLDQKLVSRSDPSNVLGVGLLRDERGCTRVSFARNWYLNGCSARAPGKRLTRASASEVAAESALLGTRLPSAPCANCVRTACSSARSAASTLAAASMLRARFAASCCSSSACDRR